MNKKEKYIAPEIYLSRLFVENLLTTVSNQDFTTPELSDAKESEFGEEEGLINPTQPNLWDDNEEE